MSFPADPALECLTPRRVGKVEVLRVVRFMEPRHLVAIAATARGDGPDGSTRRLDVADADVARYASRMRLGHALDRDGVQHDLPPVNERDLVDRLLEVTSLNTDDGVLLLATLVRGRVADRDPGTAGALFEAVSELAGNVRDHADPLVGHRGSGYAAAQSMPARHEVVFAIADAGVGMLGTLSSRGARDDHEAIRLALDGTSRLPGLHRGTGLPSVVALVRSLGGSLYVASGAASVTCADGQRRSGALARPFPGTLLQARLPLA